MAGDAQLVVDRCAAIASACCGVSGLPRPPPRPAGGFRTVDATTCTPRAWLLSMVVLIVAAASGTFQRFSVSTA